GGVPVAAGWVDLSSQHDSRARSQYVKGPRPWWRRRRRKRPRPGRRPTGSHRPTPRPGRT
ncbi:hypothetical protein DDE05_10800, partial [Streptomyces cavourensis]